MTVDSSHMRTLKQKPATKEIDQKAIEKYVWSLSGAIADQISNSIVAAQRDKKLTISDRDVQTIIMIARSAAESAAPGATKTLVSTLKK